MKQIKIAVNVPLAAAVNARSPRYGADSVALSEGDMAQLSPLALEYLASLYDGKDGLEPTHARGIDVPAATAAHVIVALETEAVTWKAKRDEAAATKVRRDALVAEAHAIEATNPGAATEATIERATEVRRGLGSGFLATWLDDANACAAIDKALANDAAELATDPTALDAPALPSYTGCQVWRGQRYVTPAARADVWAKREAWIAARSAAIAAREATEKAANEAREEAECEVAIVAIGTDSQRERWNAGVLGNAELRDVMLAHYLPEVNLAPYKRLEASDLGGECEHAFECKVIESAFKTLSAATWETLKVARATAPKGATVSVWEHVASCERCEAVERRLSVRVALEIGGERLVRHYAC